MSHYTATRSDRDNCRLGVTLIGREVTKHFAIFNVLNAQKKILLTSKLSLH
jgi:hypothetical protein